MLRFALISCLCVLLLFGCGPMTKEQFIERYDRLVEQAAENHENYSDQQWEQKSQELEQYLKEEYPRFEKELTPSEKTHIGLKTFEFYALRLGEEMEDAGKELKDVDWEGLRDEIENLGELGREIGRETAPEVRNLMEELRDAGKNFKEEWDKSGASEELSQGLRDLAKELEKAAEELEEK